MYDIYYLNFENEECDCNCLSCTRDYPRSCLIADMETFNSCESWNTVLDETDCELIKIEGNEAFLRVK